MTFDRLKWAACREFAKRCTVPIVARGLQKWGVHGTGTFFEIDGISFLVTAAHVLKELLSEDDIPCGVPLGNAGESEILDFSGCQVLQPDQSLPINTDAAVVILPNDQVQDLKRQWTFLSVRNVGKVPEGPTDFIVVGFPTELNSISLDASVLEGELLSLLTTTFKGEPEGWTVPPNDDLDLFLEHKDTMVLEDGSICRTPEIHGMSGASVWAILPEDQGSGLWIPENAMKVVGVQGSVSTGSWMRAASWAVVVYLVKKHVDPTWGT